MDIDLKWSLWTDDVSIFRERAPEALGLIRAFLRKEVGDLEIRTAPHKEIRFGRVRLEHGACDTFRVTVSFRTAWDEPSALAETLGILPEAEDEDADAAVVANLIELLPCDLDGEAGIEHEAEKFFRHTVRLGRLFAWIDRQESALLAADEQAWRDLEAAYKS